MKIRSSRVEPLACIFAAIIGSTALASPEATERAKKFVAAHETRIRPLDVVAGQAWWTANITGKDEDFKKKEEAQNKIDEALSDKATFAELKAVKGLKDKGDIDDKVL